MITEDKKIMAKGILEWRYQNDQWYIDGDSIDSLLRDFRNQKVKIIIMTLEDEEE